MTNPEGEVETNGDIEVIAEWGDPASRIWWRCGPWCDDDDPRRQWQSTPFSVLHAQSSGIKALILVDAWVEQQSPGSLA